MPQLDDVYKSNAIIYGEEREHYDEWFATASMELKKLFAELGYYPDELVHEHETRIEVVEHSSEYCAQYARYVIDDELSKHEYASVFNMCETCPNLDRETIEKLLSHPYTKRKLDTDVYYKQAFSIKHEGLRKELSLIEKTMSNYQLYRTNNSAWAKNVAINAIVNIQYAKNHINGTMTEALFNELVMDDNKGVSFGRCIELINELNERN